MTAPQRKIQICVPDEPPIGSVVVDVHGDAWQRRSDLSWIRVLTLHPIFVTQPVGSFWRHLVVDQGPLTVVHTPAGARP